MIRGHVALMRQLRSFMETSGLPWGSIREKSEYDDEGSPVISDDRAEIVFVYKNRTVSLVIWAPGTIIPTQNGPELLPLGRLAARCEGSVVKGPIDQTTWDAIVKTIRNGDGNAFRKRSD